ncbi:MAG: NAD-dependent 4,6-dehydratase LegB [Candidatus Aminicenantes bacterium]|nr:NAD-dependent 4,6-dehydratase LegB [Candidatus Aminicenantes bacterium]
MQLKDKNVLITGADGFIGSHLVEHLVEKGADVKALSCYNSFNYWGWLEDMNCLKDIEVVTGDIRDSYFVKEISKNVDVIFNLAALIAIPYSYIAPASYVDTNIKGTLNICQAALDNGCARVVHTSTSEVYGTALYVPIDEKHPLQPQSPYSASKIGADAMAKSFYNSFDLPLIIARPFNTYGPRQSARAIIPTLITQIAAGKKEIKLGNLTPTRDFNYAKDTARGFALLAECDEAVGEVVNIGSGSEISIKDLCELIKKVMGADVEFSSDKERLRPGKSEVERLLCDNSKIKELVSYKPEYSLEEGLTETSLWIKKNLEKYKVDIYNV